MFNPFRWFRVIIEFFQWYRSMTMKDKGGRLSGFLYTRDDPDVADFYKSDQQVFQRRVFISFERSSLTLVTKFESALKRVGLAPWRYEPHEPSEAIKATAAEYTLRNVKARYPETMSSLMATVRRCPAVLFIVSAKTHASPLCQLEALAAAVIHSFWPEKRVRNEAGVFVVLEAPGVLPPAGLEKFWSHVYEPGLEDALAELISNEMDRLAEIFRLVEDHRAKIYR